MGTQFTYLTNYYTHTHTHILKKSKKHVKLPKCPTTLNDQKLPLVPLKFLLKFEAFDFSNLKDLIVLI